MSCYQVQRCIYERLKAFGAGTDSGVADLSGYELSDEERRAIEGDDIVALASMGVHPVLVNAYCRSLGILRDDYRRLLEPLAHPAETVPRWRSSHWRRSRWRR
jgi:hypothetical protein